MKKLLFSVLFVGLAFAASAQSKAPKSPEARATATSQMMLNDLQLDEGTYIKVKNLYLNHYNQQATIEKSYASDKAVLSEKLQQNNAALEAELRKILQPEQFAMFQQTKYNK